MIGNIYTFNNGSKQVNDIKQGDIVYNSVDNEFVTIKNVSTRYEPILELNVFKTRPIQLTRTNQVLTIQNDNNYLNLEKLNKSNGFISEKKFTFRIRACCVFKRKILFFDYYRLLKKKLFCFAFVSIRNRS